MEGVVQRDRDGDFVCVDDGRNHEVYHVREEGGRGTISVLSNFGLSLPSFWFFLPRP